MSPKKCQWGRHQHCQRLQSVFEEDETEEATEKKIKNLKKSKKKESKKNRTVFFFFNFSKLPPKKDAQGNAVYILSALNVCLKRMKHKRLLKGHPPNVRRGQLFFSIVCGRLSFYVSRFLNTGIEQQH